MSKRMRIKALTALLTVGLVSGGLALARSVEMTRPSVFGESAPSRDIQETIWFQGFLADVATGDPISGAHDVSAEIFDGGGSVWGPETHLGVTVTEGWFNIELGSLVSPLPAFDDPPYYLEITIDGEALDPVLRLGSVPSAFRASAVDAELALPYSGTVSSSMDAAFSITNTGTSNAGYFEASNVASSAAALSARHEGDGPAVLGWTTGSGHAIVGHADGPGLAGLFEGNVVINDTLATAGLWLSEGAEEGYVLTCDDSWGHASWQPSSWPELPYRGELDSADNSLQSPFMVIFDGGSSNTFAMMGINSRDDPTLHSGVFGGAHGDAGTNRGVVGSATMSTGTNTAILGEALGSDGSTSEGGYFYAAGDHNNYGGRFAAFWGDGVNYAGYFEDDVEVVGYLYKTGGGFRIDHPFDPLGKYLQHSFVESPDMKNVYDGVVALDASGEAWVDLPDWFDALNRDFRYQLTCIGSYAPVYVADEIAGNRFRIAGGKPGMKVSWQVTGIRHDPAAEQRRIAVEMEKPESERGRYRYPEAYGLPRSRSRETVPVSGLVGSSP